MRLFSDILLVVAFVAALTVLPLALTRLSYRVFPWSIEDLLWRGFGWVMAQLLRATSATFGWLAHRTWRLRRAGRLGYRVHLALWDVAHATSPLRWHLTAYALHEICTPCVEAVEREHGWWDFEVDCAGHRCGECYDCRDRAEARADMRPGKHSARA